ncbi:MAG: TonB-dependent receptor [Acidobacteriota bacterium]
MLKKHSLLMALALLLGIAPIVVLAQTSNITILGSVRDGTGVTITGAEVKLEGAGVGVTRTVVTGSDGQYQITDISPGTYQVVVTATGFKQAVATVTLTSDARQIVDLGIETRGGEVTLTVTTRIEIGQKEDSIVGGVLDSRRTQDLPLNVRVPYNFIFLQPGAVHAPANFTDRLTNNSNGSALQDGRALPITLQGLRDIPAVNGNRPISSNYMLDGVDNNNQSVAGFNTNLSPDAVQELRIATHNYSAEYGRNSGFVAVLQTKSGATGYHGSIYEFFNNDALNANSFFAGFVQPDTDLFFDDNRDRIRRNQFGATIGGPVIPGSRKVFFFGSAEFHRIRSALINTVNVPTPEFIQSLPFATPQRILLELFPPTRPSFGFFDGNGDGLFESGIGVASIYRSINRNMWSFRTDVVPSNRNRFVFRWVFDDYNEDALQGQLPGAGFGYQGFGTKLNSRGQNGIFQWVHVVNPTIYNDFTFGYNRYNISTRQPIAADAPLVLVQPGVIPQPSRQVDLQVPEMEDLVTGVSLPGLRSDLPSRSTENTFQFTDIVSVTRGDHHIKAGVEYRRLLAPSLFDAFGAGKFTFLGLAGAGNTYAAGNPLYTQFLFDPRNGGLPDTYRTFRRNEGFLFIQDDFKVTSNLTVNVGLRYEYYGVVSSKRPAGIGNLDSNFFFGGGNDFFANVTNGGFVPTDLAAGSLQDRLYGKDTNNFAPRIGFAYDLRGQGRTVVRGSYGIFYDRVLNRLIENVRFNPPFSAIGLFTAGPINTFNTPLDRTEIAQSFFAPNGFQVDARIRTPYVQQWFLGVQHDLGGNTMLELNYIGNTGRNLVVTSDVNRVSGMTVFGGGPILGRPNPTVARLFLTETTAKSFYNALQVNVNRRFSNGLQANFSYVYSHAIDEVSDPFRSINGVSFFPSEALVGPMEVRDFRLERGSADFDIRHRAIINVLYDLPFYRTQQGLKGHLLGGWQINSLVTLQSGHPFTIFAADDANGDLVFYDRARFLGSSRSGSTIDDPKERGLQYLNPFDFVPSSAFGFGNSGVMGRNVFTGPTFHNIDFSVIKNTKITEDVIAQIRAEFFNLFNKVNFMNPHGNLSNPATFNLLTNTYNPRMIQLAFRLQF